LAAEFDSWRKVGNRSVYNINAYAHLLPANRYKKTILYPFVGLGRETKKHYEPYDAISSSNTIGLLFGCGIDYKLSSNLILNSELRFHQLKAGGPYLITGGSLNLAVGLAYKF
jgi:opacity protein-like surface antigen